MLLKSCLGGWEVVPPLKCCFKLEKCGAKRNRWAKLGALPPTVFLIIIFIVLSSNCAKIRAHFVFIALWAAWNVVVAVVVYVVVVTAALIQLYLRIKLLPALYQLQESILFTMFVNIFGPMAFSENIDLFYPQMNQNLKP